MSRARLLVASLGVVLLTGCTTKVAGFTSPVAHDYAAVAWLPLEQAVEQPFLTGPGFAAALQDDPTTTPAELQRRLAELPPDARAGTLAELAIGVRLAEDDAGDGGVWDSGARLQLLLAPDLDTRYPEPADFHAWPAEHAWLPRVESGVVVRQRFVSDYPLLDGLNVRIATFGGDLAPGEGVIGGSPAAVRALPIDGELLVTLTPGVRLPVLGAAEGWAEVQLPDGRRGYVALERFATLPPPAEPLTRTLRVELADAGGAVVRVVEIPPGLIHDNSHLPIRFAPLPDSAGATYTVTLLLAAEGRGGMTVRVTAGDDYQAGERLTDAGAAGDDIVFKPHHADIPPLLDTGIDALERDGDWLVLRDLPDVPAGVAVRARLLPGAGADAAALQYGVTPDRIPYGGWQAVDGNGAPLPGAMLLRTRYERDVALGAVASGAWSRLLDAARRDTPFTALWLVVVGGAVAAAARLRLRPRPTAGT